LGALLDAMAHGLRTLPEMPLEALPRMADFALWSSACESAFWHAGGFLHAYGVNRRAAFEDVVEADPLAAHIRNILAGHSQWRGTASELLRGEGNGLLPGGADWPNPHAHSPVACGACGHPLRALGIEIDFSCEGHAGARMITLRAPKPKDVTC
jgi:hypothetical protein